MKKSNSVSKEYKTFSCLKEYILMNKEVSVSDSFLTDIVINKKVPYVVTTDCGIMIHYSYLYEHFDKLYNSYIKIRSERIKLSHKEMWKEEYDDTGTDIIPSEEEYNEHYVEYIAKQKI